MAPRELPSVPQIKDGPGFCCSKPEKITPGIVTWAAAMFSAVDGMSLILGEIIQIELKDAIPTSQFWIDAANNGDQIDLIGNE